MKKIVVMVLLAVMAATGCGLVAVEELVTPAEVDRNGVDFAVAAGVADANDYTGYRNLAMARRLEKDIRAAFEVNKLHLEQLLDKNDLDYGILNEVATRNTKTAEARGELLFSERGLISMGMGMAGLGGLGTLLGLMRKRPGDVSRAEFDTALAEAGVETDKKEEEIIELVTGVQKFLNTYKMSGDPKEKAMVSELKGNLRMAQSSGTARHVATIKAV